MKAEGETERCGHHPSNAGAPAAGGGSTAPPRDARALWPLTLDITLQNREERIPVSEATSLWHL